jgi:hypothetical protein
MAPGSKAFAQADDFSDADGSEVPTYYQAIGRVAGEAPPVRHGGERYDVRTAVALPNAGRRELGHRR